MKATQVSIDKRMDEHKNKKGAKYTIAKGFKKLIYSETYSDKSTAMKREAEIKKFDRKTKEKLINFGR